MSERDVREQVERESVEIEAIAERLDCDLLTLGHGIGRELGASASRNG